MASLTSSTRTLFLVLCSILALVLPAAAVKQLETNSLNACQANSGFTASLFNLRYTPSKNSIDVNISAVSTIEARVEFDVSISAYGYEFYSLVIDPCKFDLAGFCPMVSGNLDDPFSLNVDPSTASLVPGIAYTFPDIDAKVKIYINATSGAMAGQSVACLEANVSNGLTVDLIGVKWASAIVAGLALVSSALLSGLGHSNAASHVAATALALTGYFQSQAMVGLVGIPLPPVVQSWTQDFQWSLGIVNVGFCKFWTILIKISQGRVHGLLTAGHKAYLASAEQLLLRLFRRYITNRVVCSTKHLYMVSTFDRWYCGKNH